MRWLVMIGAKTFGPMEAELVGEFLRDGKLGAGMFVREESGGQWVAIEASPFRAMVRKPKIGWKVMVLNAFLAALALWVLVVLANILWHTGCSIRLA